TGSAAVTGILSKVITNNNSDGIFVGGSLTGGASLNVTIVDSEASNNSNVGVTANSSSGHPAAAVTLRNVVVSNNGAAGLDAEPNAIFRVAHSVFTWNGSVVGTNGGTIQSYGDNDSDRNTNNNTGVLTPIPTL
ncbi:MAG: hypothetical protein ACREDJ_00155, partial [Methylocella sp.]